MLMCCTPFALSIGLKSFKRLQNGSTHNTLRDEQRKLNHTWPEVQPLTPNAAKPLAILRPVQLNHSRPRARHNPSEFVSIKNKISARPIAFVENATVNYRCTPSFIKGSGVPRKNCPFSYCSKSSGVPKHINFAAGFAKTICPLSIIELYIGAMYFSPRFSCKVEYAFRYLSMLLK